MQVFASIVTLLYNGLHQYYRVRITRDGGGGGGADEFAAISRCNQQRVIDRT